LRDAKLSSWLIWLTAGTFYLFEFIHRVIISVMIPELMESFNVSVANLGNLSACYFYAYALAQIPVGLLLDRFGERLLLSLACVMIAFGSFVFSVTNNMHMAELCRVFIGLGSAFAFVGCLKLGSIWFPAHKFAFIVGLTNLLGVTGAVLGGKPMAHAVDAFGWRDVMFASGVVGLILTIMLLSIVRDSNLNLSSKKKTKQNFNLWAKILIVLKCKQTWLVAAFGGFMVAPIATYSELWGVSYLVNTYHVDRPTAAQITTLTFIGIAIGGPSIGWLSDYLRVRKLPMLIGTLGALCSIATILFIEFLPFWALNVLHVAFGFFTSSMLLCFSLSSEFAPPKIRATSIALTNSIIMAMGALLQTISGLLLDLSNTNYNISFAPLMICYIMALACFYFIHETNCHRAKV
jgi:MFS family permease